MAVLVTGGAGYIGSHTCTELLRRGYDLVVVDDYSNGSPAALDAVRAISGRQLTAYGLDICDRRGLDRIFGRHQIESVVHLAAKKAVGESIRLPLPYYDVNVAGTISVLAVMLKHGVHRLVFTSSCSVYGDARGRLAAEDDPPAPVSPYGRSKLMCEQVMADTCACYGELSVICLRVFNPIGAHHSGALGEMPGGIPGNVMPYVMRAAAGQIDKLEVFGGDFGTADGSAVRDYIHIMDVAEAHGIALDRVAERPGLRVVNVGTGAGVSVLQLIAAFGQDCGVTVPFAMAGRRRGDVGVIVADPGRAGSEWGWRPARNLQQMLQDAWRFQCLHPGGRNG
jgi:UDP-glucose 4-epimerase